MRPRVLDPVLQEAGIIVSERSVSYERNDLVRRLLTPDRGVCGQLQEVTEQWSLSALPGRQPQGMTGDHLKPSGRLIFALYSHQLA